MSLLSLQRGAVLVVTLVILLVMTLISTSSLNNATSQSRMVANAQQYNLTFNTAESSLAGALNTLNLPNDATNNNMNALSTSLMERTETTIIDNTFKNKEIEVKLTYIATPSSALRAGVSLDASNDNLAIQNFDFEVSSTALFKSSGAITTLSRGFVYE